jgi:penicillin amidase
MPSSLDPAGGILATANARITPDGDTYPLTLGWASPYRNERIWKWLAGKNGLKREDMIALQTDVFSEGDLELAQRFAYAVDQTLLSSADKKDAQLRQAADLLRSWDGEMSVDSPAAAIVTAAREAWWPLVLEPKLGSGWKAYQWPESSFAQEEIVMHGGAEWLPHNYKNWDELLATAVRKGLDNGHAPADLKNWKYGYAHPLEIEHPLYGLLPWFKSWTGTGVVPQSGGHSTVKQVSRSFGPSQRFTMDWSDVDGSTENIVSGESGNPLSPYFNDQFPYWYSGRTFDFPFTSAAVTNQTTHTLRLLP